MLFHPNIKLVVANVAVPASSSVELSEATSLCCRATVGMPRGDFCPPQVQSETDTLREYLSLLADRLPFLCLLSEIAALHGPGEGGICSSWWRLAYSAAPGAWDLAPAQRSPWNSDVAPPSGPSSLGHCSTCTGELSSAFERRVAHILQALRDIRSWRDFRRFTHHISGTRDRSTAHALEPRCYFAPPMGR